MLVWACAAMPDNRKTAKVNDLNKGYDPYGCGWYSRLTPPLKTICCPSPSDEVWTTTLPAVSDPNGAIAKSFGVPNRVGFLGRQTFVIGADGNVKKIYRDVDVSKHVSEVLADLQS